MNPNSPTHPVLSPADAAALDALVSAGFVTDDVDAAHRDRASRFAALFQMLDSEPVEAEEVSVLTDITMARVLRSARTADADTEPRLSGHDAQALDALVESAWKPARVPPIHSLRARRVLSMLTGLERAAATASDDLVARTLGRVQEEIDRTESRRRLPEPGAVSTARRLTAFRLRDLISVAAIVLIGASILWPVLAGMRDGAMRERNASNLHNAAVGFSLYGSDHDGELPRANIVLPGTSTWWDVGDATRSHSANLFSLVKKGYTSLSDLASPGNPLAPVQLDLERHNDWRTHEEVSYSYQLFSPGQSPRWNGPVRHVVLADKSPVVLRARRGESADPSLGSPNHRGAGQHVLYSDGSVIWLLSPVTLDGDNIWLPGSITGDTAVRLNGTETPVSTDDAFVGP